MACRRLLITTLYYVAYCCRVKICLVLLGFLSCVHGQTDVCNDTDYVLLIDESGSICNSEQVSDCQNWQSMLDFASTLSAQLLNSGSESRLAAIRFGTASTVAFDFRSDISGIQTAIEDFAYNSWQSTRTDLAFQLLRTDLVPVANNIRVILITDGVPTDESAAITQAEAVHNDGIRVIGIGIRTKYTVAEMRTNLEQLASGNVSICA